MNKYLIDKLKEGRINKGYKQSDVTELTGIKKNTISNYENGITEPDIDTFLELCRVYELDYASILEEAYDYKSPNIDFSLNHSEISHIKKYRTLDEHGKEMVDMVLDKEYERRETKEFIVLEPPLLIPYYGHIASAGTGQYVFNDIPPEMIEVEKDMDTMQANFAIGVNGNSMEPTYKDGDTLLVKKQPKINKGEIGIFMVNGEAFVKELGDGVLISHNKEYGDISIDETTICIGKVLGKQ